MKKILFLLIFSGALFGQGQYIPARTVLGTVNGITRPISGATITVCAANTGGIPCSPALANTVFQDQALQVPLSNPFQTDSNGNYPQAAVASGTYTVTESAAGFVGFSYQLPVTCSPGVGCTFGPIVATSGTINGPLTVTGTSTLQAVSSGPVTATSVTTSGAISGASATISGTTTANGVLNANGNNSAGNVALKNFAGDQVIYVSTLGNDSNDGLSWGTAKLTPQAAFNTATATGTKAGTVYLGEGSFSCPSTWYSNLTVVGLPRIASANYNFSIQATTLSGTILSCTSANESIASISNSSFSNFSIDFNNTGFGLIVHSVVNSNFYNFGVNLAGGASNAAIKMEPGATGPQNNTAWNVFYNLTISTNTSTAATDCILLQGTGPVNAGVAVTDNRFYGVTCTGKIKNGLRFELNTDTNKFYSVDINNIGTATGDALVFNSVTPGSDQDADDETVEDLCATGSFSHLLSMGASTGNHIRECSTAGGIVVNQLGGAPLAGNIIETTGTPGVASLLQVPFLNVTVSQNFNGSTSGATTVKASAVAGNTTLTLPAATDTLVAQSTTDTLKNKTMTAAGNGNVVTLLSEQGPAAAITGTGADATVYTFTIPANTMAAGKGIRVRVWASHSSGTASVTWKLTFGATTFYNNATTGAGTGYWEANIFNNAGVQTAQHSSGVVTLPATTTFGPVGGQTAAENTTGAITVKLTFNVAATDQVTPQQFIVELIQ